MAYMSQEKKAIIAAKLKEVMPKGWKYSLAVRHHSTIVLTIKSAPVDLIGRVASHVSEFSALHGRDGLAKHAIEHSYWDVNIYHMDNQIPPDLLPTFKAIHAALNHNNHDNSDVMSDYFDVGHYVDLNIGKWDKPFSYLPNGKVHAALSLADGIAANAANNTPSPVPGRG